MELLKENLNEFHVMCRQKKVLVPPKGIDYKEKKLVLKGEYEEGELVYRKQENVIFFPVKTVKKYSLGDELKIVIHGGKRCCVEILKNDSSNKALPYYNEIKALYGAGLKKCCAHSLTYTECAMLATGNYGMRPPVSFMNSAGFDIDKSTVSIKARFYADGIMLVPEVRKSAISGGELNMVENPVKQINLCEDCAEERDKGEENNIANLIQIAKTFIDGQINLGADLK